MTRSTPSSASPASPSLGIWLAAAAVVGVYLVLFLGAPVTDPGSGPAVSRAELLLALAVTPDEPLRQFVGGAWSRFGLLDRVPVLLAAGAILGVAYGLGRLLLRLLAARGLGPLETVAFAIGLGLHLLSLLVLTVGLLARWSDLLRIDDRWPYLLVVAGLVIAVIARPAWFRLQPDGDESSLPQPRSVTTDRTEDGSPARTWTAVALGFAVPAALVIVAGAMLPPWEFDVRQYHLQTPKEWIRAGQVEFAPHNVYANMPLGAEMHAVLGALFFTGSEAWWWGALVGKTVLATMTLLTGLALFGLGRQQFGAAAGAVAATLYVSTPWIVYVSTTGLIEGAVALYLLLTFAALLRWSHFTDSQVAGHVAPAAGEQSTSPSQTASSLIRVAGVAAGAAAACKYPAVLFVGAVAAGWIAIRLVRQRAAARAVMTTVLMFALTSAASGGLWYLKNLALTGNPTYPLLVGWFGGKTRSVERDRQWRAGHAVPRGADGAAYSAQQAAASLSQILYRSRWLSPVVVPLALLAFLRRRPWLLTIAFVLAAQWLLWWLTTHRIDRFWLPFLPLLCLLAGLGATAFFPHEIWRRCALGLLIFAVLYGLPIHVSRYLIDNRLLVAYRELRVDAPHPDDPGYSASSAPHRWLNQHTPAGKAVLLVGDAQPFDLRPQTYYSTCFDGCLLEEWIQGKSPAEQRVALTERNVHFVLVHWAEIQRYRDTYGFSQWVQPERFRELVANGVLKPVDPGEDWGGVQLFAVPASR